MSAFNIYGLAVPGLSCGTQDLLLQHAGSSSLTREQTWVPALGGWRLSYWTSIEVPNSSSSACVYVCVCVCESVVSDSLRPHRR